MRRGEVCYHCRFWLGAGPREKGPKGQCRRYPPVVTDRAPAGSWPTTGQNDWCGDWQRAVGRAAAAEEPGTLYDEFQG